MGAYKIQQLAIEELLQELAEAKAQIELLKEALDIEVQWLSPSQVIKEVTHFNH